MLNAPTSSLNRNPSRLLAGRITIPRRTVAAFGALGGLAIAWAGAATFYILAKDELARRFMSYQSEVRFAYEERIHALRAGLEREVTQNLVERTTFQRRAEALAARQAEIESRQSWLRQMAERTAGPEAPRAAPFRPAASAGAHPLPPAAPRDRPEPVPEDLAFPLRRSAETPLGDQAAPRTERLNATEPDRPASPNERLSALELSLDRAAVEELRTVDALRRETQSRAGRLRTAIEATGLDPDRLAPSAGAANAIGGPLVPLPSGAAGAPFATVAAEAEARSAELLLLRGVARSLPLARPLAGDPEQTSGFGYRLDPFTRAMALHTGLDLRTEPGTPVRATGAGRVVEAGWSGGYGYMVEIEHGAGVSTRYGHLSGIAVAAGEAVGAGQVVAYSGSTGRSTGPHLHYETRIGGEPVSPQRFLQAGRLLAAAEGTD